MKLIIWRMFRTVDRYLDKESVIVLRTDTMYGLSCRYNDDYGISQINKIKKQEKSMDKKNIILVGNWTEVFKIANVTSMQEKILHENWPNPVTFILPSKLSSNTIAVRFPKDFKLQQLLDYTGPLVSTSVNTTGKKPLVSPRQIKKQFGYAIRTIVKKSYFPSYINSPSTIVDLTQKIPVILRQGGYIFKNHQESKKK